MIQVREKKLGYGAEWKILALGLLLAALLALSLLAAKAEPAHAATTFTVNSTGDESDAEVSNDSPNVCDVNLPIAGSQCTLRAAIEEANDAPGADLIRFEIPGEGVKTIDPIDSPLPTITEGVTIDGYSQPGSSPNTLAKGTNAKLMIELKGSDAGLYGLGIQADNTVVRGLVINGFQNSGIAVSAPGLGTPTTGVRLEGNFIGTDPSGTQELGNGNHGVNIFGSKVIVGGATFASRNIISGNAGHGVQMVDSSGSTVQGNLIGTKKDAKGTLGNSASGVAIFGGANATVGGAKPASANTIAFNLENGVQISESTNGNSVLRNSIFSNGSLAIDLSGDGTTPNDGAGDADVGPNELQNFPLITRAKTSRRATAIRGRLDSISSETYVVRFFSNPSGGGEGVKYIGQKTVATDGQGNATFSFKPARKVGIGKTVTATATDSSGNTSELSAPKTVVAR